MILTDEPDIPEIRQTEIVRRKTVDARKDPITTQSHPFIAITERNDWEGETWTRYIPQTAGNRRFAERFQELLGKYEVRGYAVNFDRYPTVDSESCGGYMSGQQIIDAEFDADNLPDGPHSMDESKSFEQYIYKMKWTRHPITERGNF